MCKCNGCGGYGEYREQMRRVEDNLDATVTLRLKSHFDDLRNRVIAPEAGWTLADINTELVMDEYGEPHREPVDALAYRYWTDGGWTFSQK